MTRRKIVKSQKIQKAIDFDALLKWFKEYIATLSKDDARLSNLDTTAQVPLVQRWSDLSKYPSDARNWLVDKNRHILNTDNSQGVVSNIINQLASVNQNGNFIPELLNILNAPQRAYDTQAKQYYRTPRMLESYSGGRITEDPSMRNLYNRPGYKSSQNQKPFIRTSNNALNDAQFALQYMLTDPRAAWNRNALAASAFAYLVNQNANNTQDTQNQSSNYGQPFVYYNPYANTNTTSTQNTTKKPSQSSKVKRVPVNYQVSAQNPTEYAQLQQFRDEIDRELYGTSPDAYKKVVQQLVLDDITGIMNQIRSNRNVPESVKNEIENKIANYYATNVNNDAFYNEAKAAERMRGMERRENWAEDRANEFMEQWRNRTYGTDNPQVSTKSPSQIAYEEQIKNDMKTQFLQYATQKYSIPHRLNDFAYVLSDENPEYNVMNSLSNKYFNDIKNIVQTEYNKNKTLLGMDTGNVSTYNDIPVNEKPSYFQRALNDLERRMAWITGDNYDRTSKWLETGSTTGSTEAQAKLSRENAGRPTELANVSVTPYATTHGKTHIPHAIKDEQWRNKTLLGSILGNKSTKINELKNKINEQLDTLNVNFPERTVINKKLHNSKTNTQSEYDTIEKSLKPKYEFIKTNKYTKGK